MQLIDMQITLRGPLWRVYLPSIIKAVRIEPGASASSGKEYKPGASTGIRTLVLALKGLRPLEAVEDHQN
jgi:hypothetical protein